MKTADRSGKQNEKAAAGAAPGVTGKIVKPNSTVQKVIDKSPHQTTQRKKATDIVQRTENKTGLPDNLKSGIENLSGMSMDSVKVHYNSSQPAQLNALAYAQGNDIHVASGQEKHLPHEAWHVVQQRQGRVKPTMQMKRGVPVNDDVKLEREADVMGAKALQAKTNPGNGKAVNISPVNALVQRVTSIQYEVDNFTYTDPILGGGATETVGVFMNAYLDPADSRTGSKPGNNEQLNMLRRLRALYPGSGIVRGHLLNGNLGGLGIAPNLFPITGQANRQHERQVENHVKEELRQGNEVEYQVTVVNAGKNEGAADAGFLCELWDDQGNSMLRKRVDSTPGGMVRGQTLVNNGATDLNKQAGRTFRNNTLPLAWRESGQGLRNTGYLGGARMGAPGAAIDAVYDNSFPPNLYADILI